MEALERDNDGLVFARLSYNVRTLSVTLVCLKYNTIIAVPMVFARFVGGIVIFSSMSNGDA